MQGLFAEVLKIAGCSKPVREIIFMLAATGVLESKRSQNRMPARDGICES